MWHKLESCSKPSTSFALYFYVDILLLDRNKLLILEEVIWNTLGFDLGFEKLIWLTWPWRLHYVVVSVETLWVLTCWPLTCCDCFRYLVCFLYITVICVFLLCLYIVYMSLLILNFPLSHQHILHIYCKDMLHFCFILFSFPCIIFWLSVSQIQNLFLPNKLMKYFIVYTFVNLMQFVLLLEDINWLSGYRTDSEEVKQICFFSFLGQLVLVDSIFT